ncbi:MAG: cytochrome c biogenesis protein CcdC [Polyangiaceae bacterium]
MPLDDYLHAHPILLVLASLAGAGAVLVWRFRETATPVTARKIVVPPLGMSTGFCMFLAPQTRVPFLWAVVSLLVGALVFSIPMARTSRLTRKGDGIVMERSRAFLWILLGLVIARFALRAYVEQYVTPVQTGALFYLLAFGMIARWRFSMLLQYLRLQREPVVPPIVTPEIAPSE